MAEVERATREKGYKINLKHLLELDEQRRGELKSVEALRAERNDVAAQMKGGKPTPELIAQGKEIKNKLAAAEEKFNAVDREYNQLLRSVPNLIAADVPLGGEEDSVEIKKWGEQGKVGVDHLDYATARDWVDFERGAKVAGAKFYYLKNELALLENALIQFGLKKVREHGFTFMTVPDLVSSKVLEGTGFNPRSSDQSDEYFIEGEDLALIATAELPITGYHMDEIIGESDLPLFYAGFSACFRKEAGAYGKHTRGNGGWFLSVPLEFTWSALRQPSEPTVKQWTPACFHGTLSLGVKVGYRYAFGEHWHVEASALYAPLRVVFNDFYYRQGTYIDDELQLNVKVGYVF